MMQLSTALQRHRVEFTDPLYAAYAGTLRSGMDLAQFINFWRTASPESFATYMVDKLHQTFPDLGRTVRTWPRLATELERKELLPEVRFYQTAYRPAIHMSLWKAIIMTHDDGETIAGIARILQEAGL